MIMSRQIDEIYSMEEIPVTQEYNDDVLQEVKNLVQERNSLSDENDKLKDNIDHLNSRITILENQLAKSYQREYIKTNLKTICNSTLDIIECIRVITEKCEFLDEQFYLDFLDQLNLLSVDQDRE